MVLTLYANHWFLIFDIFRSPYKASWWKQFTALLWRGFLSVLKDPQLLQIKLIQAIVSIFCYIPMLWETYVAKSVHWNKYDSIFYSSVKCLGPCHYTWNHLPGPRVRQSWNYEYKRGYISHAYESVVQQHVSGGECKFIIIFLITTFALYNE
jgi:hypothetical protein